MAKKEKKKLTYKQAKIITIINLCFNIGGIIASAILAFLINKFFGLVPALIILAICLFFILLLVLLTRKKIVLANVINVLLVVLLISSNFIFDFTKKTIEEFGGLEINSVQLIAKKDSGLTAESDFFGKDIGYIEDDETYLNWAITLMKDANKYDGVSHTAYTTYDDLFNAFNNGDTDMIVMSQLTEAFSKDEDNEVPLQPYDVLFEEIREDSIEDLETVNINSTGFTVYICAVDDTGDNINKNGRADLNILLNVNPSTGKVNVQVLTRDLYVPIPAANNKTSRLSSAGTVGGVKASIETIEQYFDYEVRINYYVKVNKIALVKMVDALGSIQINNRFDFTGKEGHHFKKGNITIDGLQARDYTATRIGLPAPIEVNRGLNCVAVLQGILNKFMKNPTLDNLNGILKAIDGNLVTNLQASDYPKLLNILLKVKDKLTFEVNSMNGTVKAKSGREIDPIVKRYYVYFFPNKGEKEKALKRMLDTLEGK